MRPPDGFLEKETSAMEGGNPFRDPWLGLITYSAEMDLPLGMPLDDLGRINLLVGSRSLSKKSKWVPDGAYLFVSRKEIARGWTIVTLNPPQQACSGTFSFYRSPQDTKASERPRNWVVWGASGPLMRSAVFT